MFVFRNMNMNVAHWTHCIVYALIYVLYCIIYVIHEHVLLNVNKIIFNFHINKLICNGNGFFTNIFDNSFKIQVFNLSFVIIMCLFVVYNLLELSKTYSVMFYYIHFILNTVYHDMLFLTQSRVRKIMFVNGLTDHM